MKKLFTSVLLFSVIMSVFAISYTNNTYQKLANEYAKKAEMALDAGHYEESVEYSRLAEENAILSREYTEMMLARKDAEDNIKLAKNKLALLGKKIIQKLLILQSKLWQLWTELLKQLHFQNSTLFVLGQKQKTVTGIFLDVIMFITIHCFGKICIKQTKTKCQNQKIQTLFTLV